MAGSVEKIRLNSEVSGKTHPLSGVISLVCSGMAALILAFLVPFGILVGCSPANIAIFMVLLGLSAVLAFAGTIVGAISYRKAKNRWARFSLLFIILYVLLLIYLIQLIYA